AREVLTSPMYRELLKKLRLPKRISVFDLGSNNGGFPLLLKSEGFDFEKLVCVELNPNTFNRLEFNLSRNFGSESTALNLAVAGSTGTLSADLGAGSTSDNIYTAANGSR